MIVIHLARKPLSEGSVAQNVLKWGTGGLNVGECRIKFEVGGDAASNPLIRLQRGCRYHHGDGFWRDPGAGFTAKIDPQGRWPANLILNHLPSCTHTGTRQVKPANGSGIARQANSTAGNWIYGGGIGGVGMQGLPNGGFAGKDGTETVDAWDCVEGCPVKDLDEQSGTTNSPNTYVRNAPGHSIGIAMSRNIGQNTGTQSVNFGDVGGASRFFKQVQDTLE